MPTIAQASVAPPVEKYNPVEVTTPLHNVPPVSDSTPGFNPFLRCPLPPILSYSPDSLRQFYRSGVPQNRITSLPSLA